MDYILAGCLYLLVLMPWENGPLICQTAQQTPPYSLVYKFYSVEVFSKYEQFV